MARRIVTGIDLGSAHVRVAVCEFLPSSQGSGLQILALIKKPSSGVRKGYIVNQEEASNSIAEALAEAEHVSGARIKSVVVSVGGIGLGTYVDQGSVAISRADQEVTELDVSRAIEESETRVKELPNIRLIHTIPSEFKVDAKHVMGKPHGLKANKIEVRTLFITCKSDHLEALVRAIESTGVEVEDIFASPIAESIVTLSSTQKTAGCILVNIGAGTLTLITYEEGVPTSLKAIAIGSLDITNDIALGLKISLEEAEELKKNANKEEIKEDRGRIKKVNEIIEARLEDIFELVDTHLKKIGRSNLLPAGIIFTGESSRIVGIEDLARKKLGLPAKIARNNVQEPSKNLTSSITHKERRQLLRGPEWSIAYGLCVLGMEIGSEESLGIRIARKTKNKLFSFIKQFLP